MMPLSMLSCALVNNHVVLLLEIQLLESHITLSNGRN